MFIAQLLKLILFAAFVYALVTLFRFFLRAGRLVNGGRDRGNIRGNGPGPRTRDGVIEIDKDQYKVE